MLWIESRAMDFTPITVLRRLLIRRENNKPLFNVEKTIEDYFAEQNIKAIVLDVNYDWYKIALSSGVQKCVFKCYWIHDKGCFDRPWGKDLWDILDILPELSIYGHKYGTKENELLK